MLCLVGAAARPTTEIRIEITPRRQRGVRGRDASLRSMKRSPAELVEYLFRDNSFPDGCLLLTGTGIVPPDDFTLHAGDEIAHHHRPDRHADQHRGASHRRSAGLHDVDRQESDCRRRGVLERRNLRCRFGAGSRRRGLGRAHRCGARGGRSRLRTIPHGASGPARRPARADRGGARRRSATNFSPWPTPKRRCPWPSG